MRLVKVFTGAKSPELTEELPASSSASQGAAAGSVSEEPEDQVNPKTQEGPQLKGNLSGQSIPGVVGKHSKQVARIQRLEFVVCEEQAITMPVSCPHPF